MASPSLPAVANPYQEGSLIYTMTTPPERSNKLTPCWKGPFRVRRIPNEYQVVMRMEPCGVWSILITLNPPSLRLLISPNPYQLLKPLILLLDIYLQDFWGPVLLLLHHPRLPRVPSPLPQHQYPLNRQPLPRQARCNHPLPRQPISSQRPLFVHGDLPDSTLSLAGCAL